MQSEEIVMGLIKKCLLVGVAMTMVFAPFECLAASSTSTDSIDTKIINEKVTKDESTFQKNVNSQKAIVMEDAPTITPNIVDNGGLSKNTVSTGIPYKLYVKESGVLRIDAVGNNKDNVDIDIYYLSGERCGDFMYDSYGDLYRGVGYLAKGTYELDISSYDDGPELSVDIKSGIYLNADKTVKNNSTVGVGLIWGRHQPLLKYKAKKTGLLYFEKRKYYSDSTIEDDIKIYSYLKNSKRKTISNTSNFGVKKGKTYYIKFYNDDMTDVVMSVKIKNTSWTGKYGKTKKKAATIKKKKYKYGTLIAGSKQKCWYKIKLKSPKKVHLRAGASNGKIKISAYNASGKNVSSEFNSHKTLPAGTYYLKVYRKNSYASGTFSLRWK